MPESANPTQRDREARAVAAVARACGFTQPVAPLIVRRIPAVDKLVRADEATRRRVLADDALRASLRSDTLEGFRDTWKQATLERLRTDHDDWLRAWWLPVLTAAEHDRLLRSPAPRADHRRVGFVRPGYPVTAGAAELLADADHRSVLAGYLLVERRVAAAILDLAHEVARAHGTEATGPPLDPAGIDRPPEGIDAREHPHVAWWHGR